MLWEIMEVKCEQELENGCRIRSWIEDLREALLTPVGM